jgi:transcription initiation factor TFIIIB Brf1 subunit/transcription initiation factor TFIIB
MLCRQKSWPALCWQQAELTQIKGRRGVRAAPLSFSETQQSLAAALQQMTLAMRRAVQARNRLQARRARHDHREWQVKRRERTRQLIELGGLVAKADLITLTEDDRAVLLGLLLEAAATLRGPNGAQQMTLWRRRGSQAFALGERQPP